MNRISVLLTQKKIVRWRDIYDIITEADNVGCVVSSHVGQEPRIFVLARPGPRRWAASKGIEI